MSWVETATEIIARFEGCAKAGPEGLLIYPYLDKLAKPNVWTRGYGRTYGISEDSPPITKTQAKSELQSGAMKYGIKCLIASPVLATKEPCLAAVTSWAWNCGVGAYRVSRLCRAIREERWADAANYIRTPRTAGGIVYRGLVRRRDAERALFMAGIGAAPKTWVNF